MPNFIYLINPLPDFPTYYGADTVRRLGLRPAAFMADLATATVAACVPPDFRFVRASFSGAWATWACDSTW